MSKNPVFDRINRLMASIDNFGRSDLEKKVGEILEAFNGIEDHLVNAPLDPQVPVVHLWFGLSEEAVTIGDIVANFEDLHEDSVEVTLILYLNELSKFLRYRFGLMPDLLNKAHREALKTQFNDVLQASRAFEIVNYVAMALNGEQPPEDEDDGPTVA
jgi:hypothetical protein